MISLLTVRTADTASIAWLAPLFSIALLIAVVFLLRSFVKQSRKAREAQWEGDEQVTTRDEQDHPSAP